MTEFTPICSKKFGNMDLAKTSTHPVNQEQRLLRMHWQLTTKMLQEKWKMYKTVFMKLVLKYLDLSLYTYKKP